MLRDEISLQQEAARKREQLIIWLLVLLGLAVIGYAILHHYQSQEHHEDSESQKSVAFAGRLLQLPPLWEKYVAGSNLLTLVLTPQGQAPSQNSKVLTLEDQRQRPEIPSQFVAGWQNAPRAADSPILGIAPYHDASVNAVGASCVRIDYGGPLRPLKILCLSNDGRWKATLSGDDRDLRPLDNLVEQFTILEN